MINEMVGAKSKQWIFRQFNSEKIRHIERYQRTIQNRKSICSFIQQDQKEESQHSSSSSDQKRHTVVFLPDGQFLRKYLTLIEEIINHHNSLTKLIGIKLVLLESAAEFMDYRNTSSCVIKHHNIDTIDENSNTYRADGINFIAKETPAKNERNRIVKLCLEHKSEQAYTGVEVIPFPDLTVREDNTQFHSDDFDLFGFVDMNIEDRSKCALLRAAKFFYHTAQLELQQSLLSMDPQDQKEQEMYHQNKTELQIEMIILTDEDVSIGDYQQYDNQNFSVTMKSMNCSALVSFIKNSFDLDNEKDEMQIQMIGDHWQKLQHSCENDYESRNKSCDDKNQNSTFQKDRYGHFEYLQAEVLQKGLQQKKFFKGKLKVTSDNCREGYCSIKGEGGITYFLNENNGHFNRAIHDDIVIIEPLPKYQWEQPVGKKWLTNVGNEQDDDNKTLSIEKSEDTQDTENSKGVMPTAQVVGLCNSKNIRRRQFIATLVPKSTILQHDDNAIVVVPMDSKIPKIRIKTRIDHERIANKRLLIEIDGWNLTSMYPSGHYVKIIGDVGDLNAEIKCLLIEHEIDLSPFSASALACLPQINSEQPWKLSENEIKQRRDLRTSCRIFSVDPQGCQDIDDAMHARVLNTGDIEVGVHIADVTHFVKLHSALDREAATRGTTFYLVDRRFDMLPSLLSSNLCSLHGNTDRYAVSVIWTLSPDLEKVKSTWYGRTVIHNIQAMTYEQAHNILHDNEPDDPNEIPPPLTAGTPVDRSLIVHLKKDLKILTSLARKLRSRRENIGGAVDLSSGERGSELKFVLDKDGRPTKVTPKKELEIHHTIAELMIMSNAFVAETIYKHYPDSSILRIHRKADIESFEELKKMLVASGLKFDGTSNKSLAQTLKDAKINQSPIQDSLFQSLATRAMSEAQYVCTGTLEEGIELSHYGLGIEMYCHFTSPIRRYADIAVHHLLLASFSKKEQQFRTSNTTGKIKELPKSDAISILSGDGLKNPKKHKYNVGDDINEEFLDSLTEGSTKVTLGDKHIPNQKFDTTNDLYQTTELTRICENLNTQNRAAKNSSMKCQRLFLSLFFRNNTEVTQAVIIDLRQNGLMVYVPKFDMKGPVYLADRNRCVQLNPRILNLPASSGLPPSTGFSSIDGCRMFPDGRCTMVKSNDSKSASVEVIVPGSAKKLTFKRLDVITIQVSCDLSNTIARIPPPRLHLISLNNNERSKQNSKQPSKRPNYNSKAVNIQSSTNNKVEQVEKEPPESLFKVLSSFQMAPVIDIPMRFESNQKKIEVEGRVQTLKGRMHFGGFKESKSSSIENLSNQTKVLSIEDQARLGSYDASRQIEREATSRIQRKAAEKRNARRIKRK